MKLQRILLRWAPAGLGLEYLEEDGTLAVLHKDLPAKEDVTSAKQVRALAKQLCCEHPELLGKKRKALTAQLARLYEMDMDSPEVLQKKVASALATALINGSLARVMADEADEDDMLVEPLSSRACSRRISRSCPRPCSRPSSDPSTEAVRKQTAILLTSALHDGRLEQALAKKARKDSKDTMPPLSSVASRSSSKLSASDSSSEASRTNTSSLLSASLSDGRLEQALEKKTRKGSKDTMPPLSSVSSRTSTKASSSDSPSEALWKKTAPLLTSSMSDGCLEHAHANSMQMPEEGRPQSQAGQRKLLVHKTCPDSSEFNQSSGETMMPLFIS